jgi:hypothetical protein
MQLPANMLSTTIWSTPPLACFSVTNEACIANAQKLGYDVTLILNIATAIRGSAKASGSTNLKGCCSCCHHAGPMYQAPWQH